MENMIISAEKMLELTKASMTINIEDYKQRLIDTIANSIVKSAIKGNRHTTLYYIDYFKNQFYNKESFTQIEEDEIKRAFEDVLKLFINNDYYVKNEKNIESHEGILYVCW